MDKITIERETLLPCPFCGDDGDKGRQEVTQMIEGRNKFARITCRACGAMCPEENWNRRAALAAQPAEPLFVAAPPAHRLSEARMDGIYKAWRDMGDDVSYGDLMRMVEAATYEAVDAPGDADEHVCAWSMDQVAKGWWK